MTKDEIVQLMEDKNIIVNIGGGFFITEKYKHLEQEEVIPVVKVEEKKQAKLNIEELMDPTTAGAGWPSEIIDAKGRARGLAFMNICEVPAQSPDGAYMLRGMDKESINIIGNLVDSDDIIPVDLINSIKHYYKTTERPKAFKNFVNEGLIVEAYTLYQTGGFKNTNQSKSNGSWG